MSLDNDRTIDAIGTDKDSGLVVLTVIDHWDWTNEHAHLLALQKKLNAYFEFVESGQIATAYPASVNGNVCIDIVSRFPLVESAKLLLERASALALQLKITISNRTHPFSEPLQE